MVILKPAMSLFFVVPREYTTLCSGFNFRVLKLHVTIFLFGAALNSQFLEIGGVRVYVALVVSLQMFHNKNRCSFTIPQQQIQDIAVEN